MAVQVLIQQAGPLPIQATFEAPGDEPMYLEVNGSVWTASAGTAVQIGVSVDGQEVGQAMVFSNDPNTHRAVVPAYCPIQLDQGQHTVEIYTGNPDTVSDYNDVYTVVLHY